MFGLSMYEERTGRQVSEERLASGWYTLSVDEPKTWLCGITWLDVRK